MASVLAFDNVVIDFGARRVLRGGVEQPLEAKAFGVLAVLAGEPGRAFSRDELLDAVWGHRHVTPGVLNRVMTLLRHALGEDAHHPRLLHTLHGVGYRFDLPTDATALLAEPVPVSMTGPSGSAEAPSSDAIRGLRRGSRTVAWLLPLLMVLVAAGGWLWLRDRPASAVPTHAAAIPTLVVMPLRPIGDDAAVRVIADGLSEELIGTLARIDGLRVIAHESTRLAVAESSAPAQLARRLGISHALEGSLQQDGQSLRVRVRLVEAQQGDTLWAKDFDRDASEVLLLQREIAEAVAASLALKLGLATAPVAKSGDAEFLRRYLAARTLMLQRTQETLQTVEPAEAEFRALIRERPDDARVHAALATALDIRAFRRPSMAVVLRAEALQEAALAQRLDPSLPEPYVVQAKAACRDSRWEPCLALLGKGRALAPGFTPYSYQYGIALAQLGYLDRAEAVMRDAVDRDPINPGWRFALGRILDTRGRHLEALEQFQRSDAFAVYARWFNAVWRGDFAGALRIAEQDFDDERLRDTEAKRLQPSYIASSRALLDPDLWPQAEVEMRKFEQDTGLMNFNRVLMPAAPSHAARLIADLDTVRKRAYSTWDLLLWTKELAYLRRDPAFQQFLRDSGILAYWREHGFPAQCRPHGDGAACD